MRVTAVLNCIWIGRSAAPGRRPAPRPIGLWADLKSILAVWLGNFFFFVLFCSFPSSFSVKIFMSGPFSFKNLFSFQFVDVIYRSTLPRQGENDVNGLASNNKGGLLLSAYEPLRHHPGNGMMNGCNGSRSSWAGLPSNNNNFIGSTSTLLSSSFERRDDAATPIVEEGRIRSTTVIQQQQQQQQRFRKHSAGSLDEDFDCCDGGGGGDSAGDGTPSPSDSGVAAELEALLKEKDCEIALLRETLEQNEAVIFQVYQEKEKSWERELKKLRSIYEERMRSAQQMASQAERQLQVNLRHFPSVVRSTL